MIVDEYTRYTRLYFLHSKDETVAILLDHVRELEKGSTNIVKILRSDDGTLEGFNQYKGIEQELYAPRTPQKNGVVEVKNNSDTS